MSDEDELATADYWAALVKTRSDVEQIAHDIRVGRFPGRGCRIVGCETWADSTDGYCADHQPRPDDLDLLMQSLTPEERAGVAAASRELDAEMAAWGFVLPSDVDIEQWIKDAELWRSKRDYQRQLDAAGLDGYAFMQRNCENQHHDNMRPENIIPVLRELLELRAELAAREASGREER